MESKSVHVAKTSQKPVISFEKLALTKKRLISKVRLKNHPYFLVFHQRSFWMAISTNTIYINLAFLKGIRRRFL